MAALYRVSARVLQRRCDVPALVQRVALHLLSESHVLLPPGHEKNFRELLLLARRAARKQIRRRRTYGAAHTRGGTVARPDGTCRPVRAQSGGYLNVQGQLGGTSGRLAKRDVPGMEAWGSARCCSCSIMDSRPSLPRDSPPLWKALSTPFRS